MVRRIRAGLLVVAAVAGLALAAGCVESDESEARTPAGAPTAVNSAVQTDSEGKTVTAPPAGGEAPGGGEQEGGAQGGGGGDAAAGRQVFAGTCTSCHLNDGQDAGGVGPKLAGAGLDEATIKTTVQNGRGPMPPGLVSGEDLENVVAYVLSIQ